MFIFLSGMLFTVFQYLPLLEEENAGHKIELCKKMNANDLDGSGDGDCDSDDDCNDDDSEQDIYIESRTQQQSSRTRVQQTYFQRMCFYEHQLDKKNSPPPKV